MLAWLSEAAAGLTAMVLMIVPMAAGFWVGSKVHALINPEPLDHHLPYDSRRGRWPAILAGILAFIAVVAILGPVVELLREFGCRSATNMEDCLDPPDRDWM